MSSNLVVLPCDGLRSAPGVQRPVSDWSGSLTSGQRWEVYQGNALEKLSVIENDSIDCCVTSPPYFWLRDYGDPKQIGMEESVEEYVQSIGDVMAAVQEVLKPDGLLFLNLGDTYYSGKGESQGKDSKSKKRRFGLRAVDKSGGLGIGLQRKSVIGIPWRVAIHMIQRGWVLRSTIIWHREKCLPEFVSDRPRRSYEYVFMFAKNRRYYFDRERLIEQNIDEDVWTIAPERNGARDIDTAPFPQELVTRCLAIGCRPKGTVLDPFAGSGTTLSVALAEGHSAIGIELNHDYCRYIVNQLHCLI